MRRNAHVLALAAAVFASGGSVIAQPGYVWTGMVPRDISASGQGVAGVIFDTQIDENVAYRYVRGVGATRLDANNVFWEGSGPRASDDLSFLTMDSGNIANWGNLNCFAGNALPPLTTCIVRNIAHRYAPTTGWTNLGSFPRTSQVQTYNNGTFTVWTGGTRCDNSVNGPNDISGDGRFVVGGAYIANANATSSGNAPSGICSVFYAYAYDAQTQQFIQLPADPSGSGTTRGRADKVNGDGSVIVGYDFGLSPDPDGAGPLTSYSGRRLAVWRNTTLTILDAYGSNDSAPVTRDGTTVAGGVSQGWLFQNAPTEQDGVPRLVKWTWNGANWAPTLLGRPVDWIDPVAGLVPLRRLSALHISNDGNTIYGSATYFQNGWVPSQFITRPIVWSPSINGGVPIDFATHFATLVPPGDTTFQNIALTSINDIDASGRVLATQWNDLRNPCLVTGLGAMLYLDGTTCEPPRISFDPVGAVLPNGVPTSFGQAINVFATGSGPLQYQWQKWNVATSTWDNLVDDNCNQFNPCCFDIKNPTGSQLRLGNFSGTWPGSYRVVVSNSCGSVTSAVANFCQFTPCPTPGPVCDGIDFNGDGIEQDPTDIEAFLSVYSGGPCIPPENTCGDIDFNNDGIEQDPTDIESFLSVYSGGLCI